MKIIINNSIYDITKNQADGVLKVVSKYIPFGIYAVEKDGVIELQKDKCKNITELKSLIQKFKSKGFKVYANGD